MACYYTYFRIVCELTVICIRFRLTSTHNRLAEQKDPHTWLWKLHATLHTQLQSKASRKPQHDIQTPPSFPTPPFHSFSPLRHSVFGLSKLSSRPEAAAHDKMYYINLHFKSGGKSLHSVAHGGDGNYATTTREWPTLVHAITVSSSRGHVLYKTASTGSSLRSVEATDKGKRLQNICDRAAPVFLICAQKQEQQK